MHTHLMMKNAGHHGHGHGGGGGGGGGLGAGAGPPVGGHHNPYDMHGYPHYNNYHPQMDPKQQQQQELLRKTPPNPNQQQPEQDIYSYFNHVFRRRRR
ncbi:POU domain class 3 transcription factor 2 [Drosophila madeirensis]|uniref:POU domain class 3 transcription factor 2 n=1 Tax=Drosophila madeirensis TaxID=30013 RepID=A0AAU9FTY9_DROMD